LVSRPEVAATWDDVETSEERSTAKATWFNTHRKKSQTSPLDVIRDVGRDGEERAAARSCAPESGWPPGPTAVVPVAPRVTNA